MESLSRQATIKGTPITDGSVPVWGERAAAAGEPYQAPPPVNFASKQKFRMQRPADKLRREE